MRALLFSLVLCLAPAFALAERRADGQIALGVLTQDDTATGFLFGDFTLSLAGQYWGAELGAFGVVGRLHETYANATYRRGPHKVSLGFPRPAFDSVAPAALTQIMPRYALDRIGETRSRATHGTMFESDFLPYGVSYDHTAGHSTLSLSLHGVPDQDVVIAGLAAQMQNGATRYAVAAEAVAQNDTTDWNLKGQVSHQFEQVSLGLSAYDAAANGQPQVVALSASHDVGPGSRVTALIRNTQGADTGLGIGLEQAITPRSQLLLGAITGGDRDWAASAALTISF